MKTSGLASWAASVAFAGLFLKLLWRNTYITALTEDPLPVCILVLKIAQIVLLIFRNHLKAGDDDSGVLWDE